MGDLQLPNDNNFINKMLVGWFGLRALYLEFQTSKQVAEAMASNDANKVKLAGEIEEKLIREQMQIIDSLEQADKFIEYKNLYGVLTKAVPKITYLGNDERIDPDKMKRLKDLSKEFSSDDMQEYIAGILAGEYNQPGSYCLQTMSVIKNLSREEINMFRRFCGLVVDGTFVFGSFFELSNEKLRILNTKGIKYSDYLYLQELGLFVGSNTSQKVLFNETIPQTYGLNIANRKIILQLKKEITLRNQSRLTKAGEELYKLIDPIFDEELFNITKQELINQGFEDLLTTDITQLQ